MKLVAGDPEARKYAVFDEQQVVHCFVTAPSQHISGVFRILNDCGEPKIVPLRGKVEIRHL